MSKGWLRTPQEQLRDFGELFEMKVCTCETKSAHQAQSVKGCRLHDPTLPDFDGVTYEPKFDAERLRGEMSRVYTAVKNGQWWTLEELSFRIGDPMQSISARLRDLRKSKFGSHTVERRRRGDPKRGLFEYRVSRCEQSDTATPLTQKQNL